MTEPKIRFKRDDGSSFPDWEEKKLGECCTYRRGSFPQPYGLEQWYDETDGKPFIQVADVGDNMKINSDTKRHISSMAEEQSVFVKAGTLLITLQGTIGRVAITHYDAYVDRTLLIMQGVDSAISLDFFKYALYLLFDNEKKKADGGIIKTITKETLTEFDVYLPPLPEQQKIADFLSNVDEVIAASEEEVANLEQQKKAVMQKIFSQEVRFKREDGSDFPDWSSQKLGTILCECKEYCEKDGTYEHVSLTKEGIVPKSERYDRDFLVTDDNKKYRVTHFDDICYNPANLKFGVICRNKYGDGIFSPIYITFEVNNSCLPSFIELLVTRRDFINGALKYQQGTVYERMAVSPEDLLSITVSIPSLSEQQLIADFLTSYDEAITAAKQELAKWKELKKGLLQQMFV